MNKLIIGVFIYFIFPNFSLAQSESNQLEKGISIGYFHFDSVKSKLSFCKLHVSYIEDMQKESDSTLQIMSNEYELFLKLYTDRSEANLLSLMETEKAKNKLLSLENQICKFQNEVEDTLLSCKEYVDKTVHKKIKLYSNSFSKKMNINILFVYEEGTIIESGYSIIDVSNSFADFLNSKW